MAVIGRFNCGSSSSAASLHQDVVAVKAAAVKLFINADSLRAGRTAWENGANMPLRVPCTCADFYKNVDTLSLKDVQGRASTAFSSMTDRLIVAQNEFCSINGALPLPLYPRFSW